MTLEGRGLALGAWGAAQATAAGLSIALGGAIRDGVNALALGGAYAAGELAGRTLVTIPAMARWHGLWNAFGFAFAGLLAFALWRPASRCAAPYPTFSRLARDSRTWATSCMRVGS